ncbi:MAG: hypothetical protein IK082_02900 [Oscillospiraceae bacterium]|nr:hypothetical protein [Oscillospiraceae bacterium]
MITIVTNGCDPEILKEAFLTAFTGIILRGMGEDSRRGTDCFRKAFECLSDGLPVESTEDEIVIGTEDEPVEAQGCAESIAWEVFGKNSFENGFGNAGATLRDAAEEVIGRFPDAEIRGELVLDSEWSNTVEYVSTVSGHIESQLEYE